MSRPSRSERLAAKAKEAAKKAETPAPPTAEEIAAHEKAQAAYEARFGDWLKQCAEHRNYMLKTGHENLGEVAKALLSLSGGAIGVSLVFLKDITPVDKIQSGGLIVAAWVFLAAALLATLFGYYVGYRSNHFAVAEFDEKFARGAYAELCQGTPGGKWAKTGKVIAVVSGSCFILGLSLLLAFVKVNFTYGTQRSGTSTNSTASATTSITTTGGGREKIMEPASKSTTTTAAPGQKVDQSAK